MSYQSHYFQEVRKAQQRAYVPYSHFKVGAYLKQKTVAIFMEQMLKMQLIQQRFVQNNLV